MVKDGYNVSAYLIFQAVMENCTLHKLKVIYFRNYDTQY